MLEVISWHVFMLCANAKAQRYRLLTAVLTPVKSDQSWFHAALSYATEINFTKGRLRFSGSKDTAQQSHCVFVFDSFFLGTQKIISIEKPKKDKV
jgi:hypothetical protein